MKFWQRLFTAFLQRFHLIRFFGRNRSFKELHQSSYAQEISKNLSKRLLNASRAQTNDLLKQFDTHLTGLTEEQAYTQQMTVGLNEVTHEKPLTWWQHLWYCYRNPFNILLSLLALIAFFTDDLTGSTIISVMVILSTLLRYWQEAKSNQAADALKAMVSNTATVLRHQVSAEDLELMHERYGIDNKNQTTHQFEIPIQYLVPGDVILLSAGDMIPADCRILSAKDLFVSQAAMTGESMPVEKFPLQKNLEETSALELDNIVFMGTNIVSGSAQAVVLSTGIQTYFGALAQGKAMFVCASRQIAFNLYQEIIALRPEWAEVKEADDGIALTDQERKEIKPNAKIKLIATRHKDDEKALYDLCGTKDDRKEHDRQFKNPKSNFKIAIVVDMWLTGFDVPFLDTIYIDKPIQQHNLIQTISRVNRKFESKEKGLVVDYIGIKNQMKLALAHYNKSDAKNFEDVEQSIVVVKDHLELLKDLFNKFDTSPYFSGEPLKQLQCLNKASEYVQLTKELEHRFMQLVKRLKAAYDVCNGSEKISQDERDLIHFYLAVRSIVFKLTRGDAPDTAKMNLQVQKMIAEALEADGVDEILKMGEEESSEIDIFGDDYLAKLEKIKLPNTKIKLLQKLLAKAIGKFKQVNRTKSIDFSKRFKALVDSYNERKEDSILVSGVLEDFSNEIMNLLQDLKQEMGSFADLGIGIEEKAFYDILQSLAVKYDFTYPEDQLLDLAKAVKTVVDDKSSYPDWSDREDIRAELKVDLIVLLAEYGYPPIDHDEVYKEIFEQAENFKKYSVILES
ncbi:type I restriction enzyme endonuclease domain-containing protein [Acinetobacter baumannii]|uniref:type I restriction enzyme endonuclease domain-containing protein n=2 Tax=Acinetobacter baumannii TaxID=470 RepID=UPI000B1CBDD1|nr:type I restriction enzyme endonuclease domain-containing protein [Acinetobacter baumannii]MDV4311117.1 DUF3387 domain-containing protein [Acinetobacter baumannii]